MKIRFLTFSYTTIFQLPIGFDPKIMYVNNNFVIKNKIYFSNDF